MHAAICYMFLYFSWNNFSILPLNNVLFAPTLKHSHFPKPLQITRNSHGQYQIRRRIKFNVDVQNSLRWFIYKLLEKDGLRLLQVSFTYCSCSFNGIQSFKYLTPQWLKNLNVFIFYIVQLFSFDITIILSRFFGLMTFQYIFLILTKTSLYPHDRILRIQIQNINTCNKTWWIETTNE